MTDAPDLDGFARFDFTADLSPTADGDATTVTRPVYRSGTGPAVVVIHEVPGLTPKVADFGRRVADAGFTAYLPSLVGTPGRAFSNGYVASSFWKVCVAKEFSNWALRTTSPVIAWLRALAERAHGECGGPGVGAVGMCFSGGFALGMMLDDRMIAPVLSQPSMPFAFGKARSADLGVSDADLARIKERAAGGCDVLGLRFSHDRFVPDARWERLQRELGEHFIAVELDSAPGNPHGHRKAAHSVLTEDLDDRPETPSRAALDAVLDFYRERLLPT